MGFLLYVTCCFSLAAFNILFFCVCLIFVNLISMCLGVFLLWFILYGTLCPYRSWLIISFPMFGKFSTIISSKTFLHPFFSSSSSGTPIIRMLVCLILSHRFQSSQFFTFFLLCSALQKLFLPFYLPAHWFVMNVVFPTPISALNIMQRESGYCVVIISLNFWAASSISVKSFIINLLLMCFIFYWNNHSYIIIY